MSIAAPSRLPGVKVDHHSERPDRERGFCGIRELGNPDDAVSQRFPRRTLVTIIKANNYVAQRRIVDGNRLLPTLA
jgi:hypothetical protein